MESRYKPFWQSCFVLWCLLFLLTACQTVPVDYSKARSVDSDRAFYLEARIAVRDEDQAISGKMTWQHGIKSDNLALYSPFGQKVITIERAGARYRLTQGPRVLAETEKIDALIMQTIGYPIPVTQLHLWVLGVPVSQKTASQAPPPYSVLTADGWTLRYDEFKEINGYVLPVRMQFSNAKSSIKIAVDSWRLGEK